MYLVVKIDLGSPAFEGEAGTEAARLLRLCADRIDGESLGTEHKIQLFDINGNHAGNLSLEQ